LLTEVTAAIKSFKIYSVTVNANNREHAALFTPRLQKHMRVYRVAFMAIVVANMQGSEQVKYPGRVAYVLDRGTRHADQVIETHESIPRFDTKNDYRVGPLTFESDTFSTHLQAADVVAWARRRLAAGKPLVEDFEVLKELFTDNHIEARLTPEIWRHFDSKFSPYLTDEGWLEPPPESS
jgi:hypothetical protein